MLPGNLIPPGLETAPLASYQNSQQNTQEAPETPQPDGDHLKLSTYLNKVSAIIKQVLGGPVWLQVEVSKFNNRGQHAYFDFVEYSEADGRELAKARGTLWSSQKDKLFRKFRTTTGGDIQDGMKLLLLVKPDFTAQYGLSLVVEDIDPAYTIGDMQAKLKKIRDDLNKAGIYQLNKRLSAPFDFYNVAVVSPENAAGLADFMNEADILEQYGLCEFSYVSALFQGKDASTSILASLSEVLLQHEETPFDAVVIIRGGGAASDLAWLNDYELAKAVCEINIPVFTGIGHQVDDTILDEVAFRRFDTPSKVSAFIAGTIITNAENAIQNTLSIMNDSHKVITLAETKIESLMQAVSHGCQQSFVKVESQLDDLMNKVRSGAESAIQITEERIKSMMSEIMGLSPRNTLARGYAVLRDKQGSPITSVSSLLLSSGNVLEVELRDGRVECTVN